MLKCEQIFWSIVEAYILHQKDELTLLEIEHLLEGAKIVIYMQAIRFLTDYLNGDIYYKTSYTDHNLVRAKNQFALLDNLFANETYCKKILGKIA